MNRTQALQALANSKPELARRFGVTRLALFGSTARDKAGTGSDVDIVVSFEARPCQNATSASSSIWKTARLPGRSGD